MAVELRQGRVASALAMTALLAGCVIFTSPDKDHQGRLDEHRAVWDATGVTNYTIRFQNVCFCLNADILLPVRLTVRQDTVVEVFDLESETALTTYDPAFYLTVNRLFDFVQQAIDVNAIEIDVSYDGEMGYPKTINVDFSRTAFNDERGFQTRDLVPLN